MDKIPFRILDTFDAPGATYNLSVYTVPRGFTLEITCLATRNEDTNNAPAILTITARNITIDTAGHRQVLLAVPVVTPCRVMAYEGDLVSIRGASGTIGDTIHVNIAGWLYPTDKVSDHLIPG